MKEKIMSAALVMFFVFAVPAVWAHEEDGPAGDSMKGGMMEGGKMGKMEGGMGAKGGMMGMGSMGHMMMKSMMEATVVATEDGGVVVLKGNTLTKYDKKLEVVNEVQLKTDMEGMKKNMQQMMEACPMMKMMHGGMMGEGMKENTTTTQGQTTEESEHESHH